MRAVAAEVWPHIRNWPTWQRDLWLWAIWFFVVFPAYIGIPAGRPWLVGTVIVAAFAGLGAWGWELKRTLAERDDELAHADALITTLAAEAAAAPVPFTPSDMPARLYAVPEQREPTHDHLKADDAWFAALYDENGQHR